jgi:hypothetical protein
MDLIDQNKSITITEQNIFYLSNDILELSINFCNEIVSKIEVLYQRYCEIFKNATMHSSTTKDEFILFFNIFYTQFFEVQCKRNITNNLAITLKAVKKKTHKECKVAIETIRKTVIRAFLDVYYVGDDENNLNVKENLISINKWLQDDFEDSKIFTRLKYNEDSGY